MKAKILVIEDEAVLQKAMSDMLGEYEYESIQAIDGEQGLALAGSEKPDLILLDLVLPKKHGLEVLEELKGNEETKNIPVIVLTNLEEKEDISRAMELGAKSYLVKADYDIGEVIKRIDSAIG